LFCEFCVLAGFVGLEVDFDELFDLGLAVTGSGCIAFFIGAGFGCAAIFFPAFEAPFGIQGAAVAAGAGVEV
jgi:Kef-type K+ transport system membrane component KefB